MLFSPCKQSRLMNEPVTSPDGWNAGSSHRSAMVLTGSSVARTFIRIVAATVLLVAATTKTYQLFSDPALGVLWGSRWLHVAQIEYELLLATWLLVGIHPVWCRRVALATFVAFACTSLSMAISGATSCGCFGSVLVHPWLTFAIDVVTAVLLALWNPGRINSTAVPDANRSSARKSAIALGSVAIVVVLGLPVLTAVLRRSAVPVNLSALPAGALAVLEPEQWIGQRLPLVDDIDIGDQLSSGDWLVVLYHHDCAKCQELLPQYREVAGTFLGQNPATRIALVEVPPYGPEGPVNGDDCVRGRLNDRLTWFVVTPVEIKIVAGTVTAARSGEDVSRLTIEPDQPSP